MHGVTVKFAQISFYLLWFYQFRDVFFPVEYVLREGNRYTDLVQEQFAGKIPRNTCTSSQCRS